MCTKEVQMRIKEKITMDIRGLIDNGPITIVAFGDSVTHGAQGPDIIDYEGVYWNLFKKRLNSLRNYVPVNVINAGIGGITAKGSLGRMEKQVISHNPDLIIVAFGLNDVNGTLEDYIEPLREIFRRGLDCGAEVVFLTPNMLNTYVAEDTEPKHLAYAAVTAEHQNSGRMDKYIDAARELALSMGVKVADAYAEWRRLSLTTDVTRLLDNRINHPGAKMHELFCDKLWEAVMGDDTAAGGSESTMFKG